MTIFKVNLVYTCTYLLPLFLKYAGQYFLSPSPLLSLDISGETHVQKIPISSIPSDVLPFSNVASISVDDETSVSF